MTWASWLIGLVGPLVVRGLMAIGISTITFTGVTASLQTLIQMAQDNWSGMSSDLLGLAGIAGVPQGIGIIVGAMTARVGMWAAVSATKFVLGSS